MAGRGAWNVQGVGGTKQFKDSTKPGPYYYNRVGYDQGTRDNNERAVWNAVKVYQKALNRAMGTKLLVDGLYGTSTTRVMTEYQQKQLSAGDSSVVVWGGIGPETSKMLLYPILTETFSKNNTNKLLTPTVVSGVIKHESNWDAGAVGYVDENDVGLAQINSKAHPEYTFEQRQQPEICFKFVVEYLNDSLTLLNNNLRDAIASYNLGVGGARSWIRAGRPDIWKPTATSAPRNVKAYIDNILKG